MKATMKKLLHSKLFYIFILTGLFGLGFAYFYFTKQAPITIGFVGALTGKYSDLGVQTRNGVQLAVEELNEKGGIEGRRLHVVYMDNKGNVQKNQEALEQLAKLGIKTIIGPMLSTLALSSVPVSKKHNIILISPTVSTSLLSNKKDLFFRIIPDNKKRAKALAKYVLNKHRPKKICVIQDISNQIYTSDFLDNFLAPFKLKMATVACAYRYKVSQTVPYQCVANIKAILKENPDLVVIAASSADTAFFARNIWDVDPSIVICASNWAKTSLFLLGLGSPIHTAYLEGIDSGIETPELARFRKKYSDRFGWTPSFASVQGYDAVRVLATALEQSLILSTPLNKALCDIKNFPGLFSTISINEYGDAIRPTFIYTIKNGKFLVVRRIE